MGYNKVILMGNLTREPELRYLTSGSAVCEFGLAVNRNFTVNGQQKEETCFVDITVWGKTAEICQRFLGKGSQALIDGRLQFDQWDDKTTGKRMSKLRVVADNVQFVGTPKRDDGGAPRPAAGGYRQEGNGNGDYRQASPSGGPGGYQARGGGNYQPSGGPGAYRNAPGGSAPEPMPPVPEEAFNPDAGEDDIPF